MVKMMRTGGWRKVVGVLGGLGFLYIGLIVLMARAIVFPAWYVHPDPKTPQEFRPCNAYQTEVYEFCRDPMRDLKLEFRPFAVDREFPAPKSRVIHTTGWWIWPQNVAVLGVAQHGVGGAAQSPLAAEARPAGGGARQDGGAPEAYTAVGTDRGAVILVHGAGADRRAMLKHASYLSTAGFHVLLIDCHNHGLSQSDGRGISLGMWEAYSVIAAADWIRPQLKTPDVFVMGTSQGGFAALRAAALSKDIRGVIAENPFVNARRVIEEFPSYQWVPRSVKDMSLWIAGRWIGASIDEIDVARFAAQLANTPTLIIHSVTDKIVSVDHSRKIQLFFPVGSKAQHELWELPEGGHEALWNVERLTYEKRIIDFLNRVQNAH